MHGSPRKFVIYTRSSVSDPAWVTVLEEIFPDKPPVQYSDFSELKELITELEGRFNQNPKNFT